jgi:hypothetical protein
VTKEEARVEAALADNLDSLLSLEATKAVPAPDGKQLALQVEGVEKAFAPARLTGLTEQVTALAEHVYSCQELADKMSCSVRKLDERQMRVQRVLALVEDIINLKTCAEGVERALEEGDLPDATSYVRQFHSIEGAAAKASEHYDFMVSSEARLKETVMRKVQLAVSRSNLEDVFKFCPLLGPLGLAEEGAKIYESFAERLLKEGLDPLASEVGKVQAVQLLPKIYNVAAGFLQHHLPLVAHGFKQVDADVSLIRLVQRECEDAAIPVIRRFIKARGLKEKCRVVASASPMGGREEEEGEEEGEGRREGGREGLLPSGDLDGLMDELALVIQHTESYDRFVRYLAAEAKKTSSSTNSSSSEGGKKELVVLPVVTDLNGAIAEVSGPFAVLENHLMRSSIIKALQIDELPPLAPLSFQQRELRGLASAAASAAGSGRDERDNDPLALSTGSGGVPQTSSCVDDTFYVVRRCARRALVTGHAGTASAIVNYINSTLLDELMSVLSAKVRSLKELPLPMGVYAAPAAAATAAAPSSSSSSGGRNAGAAIVAAKQHWSRVKGGLEAGLETAQQLTAVAAGAAGSLMGGAGIGLVGGGAGTITYYPPAEAKLALNRLVMLNNLAACAFYTVKLQQELVAEVPSIFQDDPSTAQLMVCLGEMSETSRQFEQACEEGLQHVGALIKPKLRGFLQDALGVSHSAGGGGEGGGEGGGGGEGESNVTYELDEEDFAGNEAVDPWVHRFVEFLGGVLGPISQRLSDRGFEGLKMAVVDYLVKRLEYLLMRKSFTQLGALQLDKDLRCLLAFFPSGSGGGGGEGGRKGGGRGGVRERFARLMQMNQLLNLDVPTDAVDVFGGPMSKLTLEEALNVMRLRVDWEEAEIGKAQQHLLMASSGGGGMGDGGFF